MKGSLLLTGALLAFSGICAAPSHNTNQTPPDAEAARTIAAQATMITDMQARLADLEARLAKVEAEVENARTPLVLTTPVQPPAQIPSIQPRLELDQGEKRGRTLGEVEANGWTAYLVPLSQKPSDIPSVAR